ncbi:type II toxin-antitoxin system VapC family toxin [Klenkia sp. LSe6-5]|uniref:Ribonuclease VapC n=1 Tax=Klenkia sesuvii TaxID=3103137 RepID=A0ABU8DYF4_9ACTN
MLVIDASVLTPVVLDDGETGRRARARVADQVLAAPELVDLEVASVVRRQVLRGAVPPQRARRALLYLTDLPLARYGHRDLVGRGWELRDAVSTYDVAYVALAEVLSATLLTADARLARAPGTRCPIEVFR